MSEVVVSEEERRIIPTIFDSQEYRNDPFPTYQKLRDYHPLYHDQFHNSWMLSRYEDVRAAFLDNENYLFLKSRKDDIINIGGEKVIPMEIEEVVKQIPEVIDVVAFGIKNEIFGQVIKLQVIKSKESNLEKSKILIHCIKNLEKFKIPNKIEFVEEIPKTSYGKVKRFMLK